MLDSRSMSRKTSFLAAGLVITLVLVFSNGTRWRQFLQPSASEAGSDDIFSSAFESNRSNFVAEGRGTVIRILADDNDGSRHQRFILRLGSGQTLLVAHNIDLAPRIDTLSVGDEVSFKGEYEWSDKGGTIHWTHHDPAGRHEAGWLRHDGVDYQ